MASDDDTRADQPEVPGWATLDHNDPESDLFAAISANGVLLCRACRASRQCRLGIHREQLYRDGSTRSDVICPSDHEGGPQVAHGGWTAAVLDELSGHCLLMRDEFAVTGELAVKFVKPIPIERPLSATSTVTGRDGRRVLVSTHLQLAETDVVVAVGHAVMIRRPGDHFARHQDWLTSLDQPTHD